MIKFINAQLQYFIAFSNISWSQESLLLFDILKKQQQFLMVIGEDYTIVNLLKSQNSYSTRIISIYLTKFRICQNL